jgi:dinuclear metal center YbgI/SA1388 family protein
MRIYDVVSYLENLFPVSSQASFDNCGLLVGDRDNQLSGALICLDCTEEIIEEAIDAGKNLIIAHHPIIFKGIKRITGSNSVERIIIKAIQHNICIYAVHTNLDHSLVGVNAEIARRLGVVFPRILQPSEHSLFKLSVFVPSSHQEILKSVLFHAGAGKIGNYEECSYTSSGLGTYTPVEGADPFDGEIGVAQRVDELKVEVLVTKHALNKVIQAMLDAHPYEEVAYDVIELKNKNFSEGTGMIGDLEEPIDSLTFLAKLKQSFHCGSIRHTELIHSKIQRVAFCGGSGSFLLKDAIQQKADIYITGDFKYHEFFDAENKIIIADIGHYESEQFTSDLIYRILTEKFVNFAISVTKVNTNPINYF